jgi:hypothetical protein
MERRMMLSVTAPEMAAAMPSFQIVTEVSEQVATPMPLRLAPGNRFAEGGFISSPPAAADQALSLVNYQLNADISIGVLLGHGSFLDTNVVLGQATRTEILGTFGVVPRVIDLADGERAALVAIEVKTDDGLGASAADEGGLITINSILAPTSPGMESKSGESLLAQQATQSAPEQGSRAHAKSAGAETSLHEISGEWARAVVFEIAGGEPILESLQAMKSQDAPVTATAQGSTEQANESNTFGAKPTATQSSAPAADRQTSIGTETDDLNDMASASTGIASLSSEDVNIDGAAQSGVAVVLKERALPAGATAVPLAATADEAVAAAFDQIGDGELALPSPSTDRLRLEGWLSGTPLLLMFALERVTARNTRRRRASDGAVEVGRPHTQKTTLC